MKKYFMLVFILVCFLVSTSSFAELTLNGISLKGGMYLRLRHEYWKNNKDMDNDQLDNRNFFRVKSSFWGQADFDKNTSLYARLVNEFKAYTYLGGTTGAIPDKSATKKGYHFDINEVVFDNLYLDLKNVLNYPVDLRIGRQDFIGAYGEGFLIMDGTPQDGSRTFYFNAAKASWSIDPNNTLDFIYINDPRDEEFLPIINRTMLVNQANPTLDKVPQNLNTTDEKAGVIYLKNKAIKNLNLEGYYIFKNEAEEGGTGAYASEKTNLSTLGSFVKYNPAGYTIRTQAAYQFGSYGKQDRRGIGGYIFVDRDFKNMMWSPMLSAGYIGLSGDNRKTNRQEGWDPLFSRYPWISELYANTGAAETGIAAYWTNLSVWRASLVLSPSKKTKLSLWYNFLRAFNQVPASAIFSGTGKNKGHLLQGKLDYTINKYVSTYFLAEYLIPGNFYKDNDPAIFLRTELQVKF